MMVGNSNRTGVAAAFGVAGLACNSASAGGISLHEVSTPDVGLAASGYSARAQDAATVLTHPSGLVRLAGDPFMVGAQLQWRDLAPGLQALLASQGLLDAGADLGVTVPQGLNASLYHQIDPRWAVLGSVGWQQWSGFGEVKVGIDSNNPVGLNTELNVKDTWHLAGGAQYRWSDSWPLNAGMACDSGFQSNASISLALPANAAWRFGIGGQKEVSSAFNWGWSLAYTTLGTLRSSASGSVPVPLGGRGDVVGSFDNVRIIFLALNVNWRP
jgi:long-chain fatty acid transport protein